MSDFINLMSYDFIQKAFIVGLLVSVCASLLGVSLVLKRYSMIGDGLSHVAFGTMAVASVFGIAPLRLAIPVVIICAFLLLRINENSKLKGDSSIALISSGAMAIGVTIVSVSSGMNTDLMNYMFGSILSISNSDAVISIIVCILIIIFYSLLYPRIFAITFDEGFARASGTKINILNSAVAILTAVVVVLGMRLMGTLLISSLIIFSPITAMTVCKTFRSVIFLSATLSILCFVAGLVISCVFGIPTGASIICVDIIVFAVFKTIKAVVSRN